MFSTYACKFHHNAISDTSKLNPGIFLTHLAAIDLTDDSTRREEHLSAEEMEMEADHSGWLVCPKACRWHDMCPRELHCHPKSERLAHTLPSGCFLLS